MRACQALLCAMALTGTTAHAEGIPAAIGRISYAAVPAADAAICTGALVAPDLVLTAGHCLRGAVDDPAKVWFAAGYRDGQSRALMQGAEVILMEGAAAGDFSRDLALLRLDRPITPDLVTPLPLADPDAAIFTLFAYRRDAPDRPLRAAPCTAVAARPAMLGLTCPVVSGNSGAPVLQQVHGDWQIVAVIVASANAQRLRALAVIPEPSLQTRIAEGNAATAP